MLSNEDFIQESLNSNLYYLRSLQEFCINIQLSALSNNQEYSDRILEISKKCEELGEKVISYADGKISKLAVDNQIFVTNYTLSLEKLTEYLFKIDINTDLTEKELKLTAGEPKDDPILVNELMEIDKTSLELTNSFIVLCKEIHTKYVSNEIFFYSYPTFFEFMIYEMEVFVQDLNRLIKKDPVDPIFAINNEFLFNEVMRTICAIISGVIDPKYQVRIDQAYKLLSQFTSLRKKYQTTTLTPANQKELTEESTQMVINLQGFIKSCIDDLLHSNLQLITDPIFLDNMLTKVNYYKYILDINKEKQSTYT